MVIGMTDMRGNVQRTQRSGIARSVLRSSCRELGDYCRMSSERIDRQRFIGARVVRRRRGDHGAVAQDFLRPQPEVEIAASGPAFLAPEKMGGMLDRCLMGIKLLGGTRAKCFHENPGLDQR